MASMSTAHTIHCTWLVLMRKGEGRIGLVISDTWAKTPNDDDTLAQNLLISDN